jgi:hypothetical protein
VWRKAGVVGTASVTEMMFCWAFSRSVRWCSLETESSSAPMPEVSSSKPEVGSGEHRGTASPRLL